MGQGEDTSHQNPQEVRSSGVRNHREDVVRTHPATDSPIHGWGVGGGEKYREKENTEVVGLQWWGRPASLCVGSYHQHGYESGGRGRSTEPNQQRRAIDNWRRDKDGR